MKCKHGEFDPLVGCPECMKESQAAAAGPLQIVKVQYRTTKVGNGGGEVQEYGNREYTYYSEDRLQVGDIVTVPVRDTKSRARVSTIDVPAEEVEAFKDRVKTIPAGSVVIEGDDTERITEDLPFTDPGPYGLQEWPQDMGLNGEFDPQPEESALSEGKIFEVTKVEYRENNEGEVTANYEFSTRQKNEALIRVEPKQDTILMQLYDQGKSLLKYAEVRTITTDADLKLASDDLVVAGKVLRVIEDKRKEYTTPIRQYLDEVNTAFKDLKTPASKADQINREKVLAYQQEQEAKARKAEEINRKRMEAAQEEMELNGEISEPVELVEQPRPAPEVVRSTLGTTGKRANWKWRVVDIDKVPREYMVVDSAMLTSIAKKHHDAKPVPGIEFYNDPGLSVR